MSNQAKVYKENPDKITVASGGSIQVLTGGKILPNSGTQATHIADPSGGATQDAEARAAINAILAAIEGAGIVAAS